MLIIGLVVPYNDPGLIGQSNIDSKASPFILAIKNAGIQGLDSVMNAVVMISVLSVANSSMYAATRTLAALAEQGQAPKILSYIDREGRPLVSVGAAMLVSLLAYLYVSPVRSQAFAWLLACSGLSSIFTWLSICISHIRFRKAWLQQGNSLDDLVYRSSVGTIGSWVGIVSYFLILVAQLYVAIAPEGGSSSDAAVEATNFFQAYLAMPLVMICYIVYKVYYRTKWIRISDIDLSTGRSEFESELFRDKARVDRSEWPRWKVIYKTMC